MITEIVMVDTLNTAIDKLDDTKTMIDDGIDSDNIEKMKSKLIDAKAKLEDAKDDLITQRDNIQKDIDQFDKWAEAQSDIDTSIQLEVDKALGK